jgi:hypothetical protein
VLISGKEEVIKFHSRLFGGKLPSEIIFAQRVLNNKVIISRLRCFVHQYTFNVYHKRHANIKTWVHIRYGCFDLNVSSRLANSKADIGLCGENSEIVLFRAGELFYTKRSHNQSKTISVEVNYVLKVVLQVYNHFVLISYGVYQASTISEICVCKTNYVYSKHRSIFICVSKEAKINLKCIYFVKFCLYLP